MVLAVSLACLGVGITGGRSGYAALLAHADWPRKGLDPGAFKIHTQHILLPDERVKVQ